MEREQRPVLIVEEPGSTDSFTNALWLEAGAHCSDLDGLAGLVRRRTRDLSFFGSQTHERLSFNLPALRTNV
jgi:hypothetical protein